MNSGVMSDRRTAAARDRRRALRYSLKLAVEIEHAHGWVRDFSASGIFVETDRRFAPGSPITFSLVLGRLGSGIPLALSGEGRVIRTDRRDDRHGVAVEITSWEKAGECCDVEANPAPPHHQGGGVQHGYGPPAPHGAGQWPSVQHRPGPPPPARFERAPHPRPGVLRQRYARGEIDKEELEAKKRDLS